MDSILSIIPKITSPLAVICFCVYVFYLFKQSSDKKKEKSLSVQDRLAQRNAVTLILKDYPDIVVDPIKDPTAALELAKQIIHDKLSRYRKTLNFLLLFALIFAITFLASLSISNNNLLKILTSNNSKSWAEKNTISNGNKTYPLLSVVCHIKLEDSVISDHSIKRFAFFRNYYTLKALRDITTDDNVFEEQFITNSGKITPWPGSEMQVVESITAGRYWVKFTANKSDIITLATGANYEYLNLTNNGTGCFGDLALKSNEWFTCYPNTSDYIDHLTIIIEGSNVDVSLPPNSSYRKNPQGAVSIADGACKVYTTNNHCTLISKWSNISPGECVGFKINSFHKL